MTNRLGNKGYRPRDSISGCGNQSDLYYTISNPLAPKRPVRVESSKPDTIESLQHTLESEIEKKLHKDKNEQTAAVLFIAKASKLFFMMLVFPPYFVFFVAPKFLLTQAVPALFHFLLAPFKKGAAKVRQVFVFVETYFQKLVEFFKVKLKGKNKAEKKSLIQRARERVVIWRNALIHFILTPVRFVKAQYTKISDTVKIYVKSQIQRMKNGVSAGFSLISRKINKFYEKLADGIQQFFLTPISSVIVPRLSAIKRAIFSLRKKAVESGKKLHKEVALFLKDPAQWMANLGNVVILKFIQVAAKINAAATERATKYVKEIFSIMLALRAKVYDLGADRLRLACAQIHVWVQNLIKTAKKSAQLVWIHVVQRPKQLAFSLKIKVIEWLQTGKRWSQQKRQNLTDGVVSTLKRSVAFLNSKIRSWIVLLKQLLVDWANWLLKQFRVLPMQLLSLIKKGSQALILFSKNFLYGCRVGLAWGKVLCREGMKFVRQAAEELIIYFRRPKNES